MSVMPSGQSELGLRVISAAIMATVAIFSAWLGGWPFALVWTAAALIVAFEWQRIVHGQERRLAQLVTAAAVIGAGAGAWLELWPLLLASFAMALPIALLLGREHPAHTAEGVIYACALAASVILCRGTENSGLVVILWLFASVWGTDTCAYFTGRALGGPKLWPRVSPKKTWSGALGGLLGGAALGLAVLAVAGFSIKWPHVVLSLAFSVATQAGDLFESSLKRRYDVKDAGSIIPGHGGVMDRLDGFIFAATLAALVGVVREGITRTPYGLTNW